MLLHSGFVKIQFAFQIPYHVTVVLNPAACGGKGRARFESYCAPLLHLAGIKVSVIRTEGEGQAKDIMEVIKDCDAVLLAGGDGTLMEAVTGWMRRETVLFFCTRSLSLYVAISRLISTYNGDSILQTDKFKLPIGLLPVGYENRMARNLFPSSANSSDAKLMAEATM